MARPERFELPTLCFEGRCSIQLSYGRTRMRLILRHFRFRLHILSSYRVRPVPSPGFSPDLCQN